MNDDELLDALQRSMMAQERAPAHVRTAALAASDWRTGIDALLAERPIESGTMRSDATAVTADRRDFGYGIDGYELHVTIDGSGESAVVHGVVRPAIATVILQVPGRPPERLSCTASGSFSSSIEATHVAIAFTTADGRFVRTPLIELS